jgi:hypothetical protein
MLPLSACSPQDSLGLLAQIFTASSLRSSPFRIVVFLFLREGALDFFFCGLVSDITNA